MKSNYPDLANAIAQARLAQVNNGRLCTACPLCYAHFKENAGDIQVMEFSEALITRSGSEALTDGITLNLYSNQVRCPHAKKQGLPTAGMHLEFKENARRSSGRKPLHDVVRLAQWAAETGIDLVPRGAGTGLCGGATPQNSVVVDSARLRQIGALNIQSKQVIVDAGVPLDQLNRTLRSDGLFLPVIPGSHRSATIGGMIATNAAGLHAVRYGRMSDWVEEVLLVDGKGEVQSICLADDRKAFCRTGRDNRDDRTSDTPPDGDSQDPLAHAYLV